MRYSSWECDRQAWRPGRAVQEGNCAGASGARGRELSRAKSGSRCWQNRGCWGPACWFEVAAAEVCRTGTAGERDRRPLRARSGAPTGEPQEESVGRRAGLQPSSGSWRCRSRNVTPSLRWSPGLASRRAGQSGESVLERHKRTRSRHACGVNDPQPQGDRVSSPCCALGGGQRRGGTGPRGRNAGNTEGCRA